MNSELWAITSPSHSVFDSASLGDNLKKSRLAISLINQKINGELKTMTDKLHWVKKVNELLGFTTVDSENESVVFFKEVLAGKYDSWGLGYMIIQTDIAVDDLKKSDLLSGGYAELAHKAMTYWADLEVGLNVSK